MRKTEQEINYLEHVQTITHAFIQRRDIYPQQINDGSYVSIQNKLTDDILISHLQGKITLGAYVLDRESFGHFMVLDADTEPEWRKLRALSDILKNMDCPSYLESSRRGGHLWLFFLEFTKAKDIRLFGSGIMGHFGIEDIELFPKQDELTTGPGSLIRLPFGIHRKSGRRYSFIHPMGTFLPQQLEIR